MTAGNSAHQRAGSTTRIQRNQDGGPNLAEPLTYESEFDRLTHYVFRYPAKFHPPIARALLTKYTEIGGTVLDPFCGSGTLLVEAAVTGRKSIGIDIDPVAVFVSTAKTAPLAAKCLEDCAAKLEIRLSRRARSNDEYINRQFVDLTETQFRSAGTRLRAHIPAIPNIEHWFRRYVIVDLARIKETILAHCDHRHHLTFYMLVFASIIRASSNADPVPVSGLEVTSHMLRRDELGRVIDPFKLYAERLTRSRRAAEEYAAQAYPLCRPRILHDDATTFAASLDVGVDAVITSPPYHNAVDYYRRHTLEMYWLGLVVDHAERLDLLTRYIGRARVRRSHAFVKNDEPLSKLARQWFTKLETNSTVRAEAFKHYVVAMRQAVRQIATVLKRDSRAVFVLGKSTWNGETIPTTRLFRDVASGYFELEDTFSYPLRNRYMSYSRQNGADINREYVLVFRRT